MSGSSPQTASSGGAGRSTGNSSPGRGAILLLLIVILLATFLAIRFVDLPGSSTEDDTPVLLAQTGCFDMDLIPADHTPPISADQAEAEVRARIGEVEPTSGSIPDEDELGSRVWADYGELAPGTAGRVLSGDAWVLVFDLDKDASWWRRLTIQDDDYRYSVIYFPESDEIAAACSDEA